METIDDWKVAAYTLARLAAAERACIPARVEYSELSEVKTMRERRFETSMHELSRQILRDVLIADATAQIDRSVPPCRE